MMAAIKSGIGVDEFRRMRYPQLVILLQELTDGASDSKELVREATAADVTAYLK